MHPKELTDDAKAILLLCSRFGKNDADNGDKPLSLGEYNQLADWMMERNIRPSDLLTDAAANLFSSIPSKINANRVKTLLSRGTAMAFAVEKWTNTGIWIICRSDTNYPERLKQHLKKQA